MGSSVSASGISGGSSETGLFRGSLRCSTHLFSCSSAVVNVFPSLSLIGLSVNQHHAESFLVVL